MRRKMKGDLKADADIAGMEMSDYDKEGNLGLHVPYGPGWDAARINRLVYKTVSCFLKKGFLNVEF